MEKIHGYEVTKFVQFDNDRGIAFAHNPAAVQPFVTWWFSEENGKRGYEWGHYFSKEDAAVVDFIHRVNDYQQQYSVDIAAVEPQQALQARYCYFSTQRPVDIGTFPKTKENAPMLIFNFEQRQPVQDGAFQAWGELVYPKPLTRKELSDYELKAAWDNPLEPGIQRGAKTIGTNHTKHKNHPQRQGHGDR